MAERVSVRSERTVAEVLAGVADEARRQDAEAAVALITELTGAAPTVWGDALIGFGRQPYRTADGTSHEWFAVGVAPPEGRADVLRPHLRRGQR